MKMFAPGTLLRRKTKEPLELYGCIEPWDIGVTGHDVFKCDDPLWLVVGAWRQSTIGLPYYYVVGSSGFHGWTSARYMLEKVSDAC